jgi:hypothetical protein
MTPAELGITKSPLSGQTLYKISVENPLHRYNVDNQRVNPLHDPLRPATFAK